MASTNKTPNYQLNQWEGSDYYQRIDFNADNNKLDTNLKRVDDLSTLNKNDIVNLKITDGLINTKPSTQMVLEAEETKSASIDISGLINPKYEGRFRQNLIDTHKCIYKMEGDYSPIPVDITDNSMKVMAFGDNWVGAGCFVGVTAGREYTIKTTSVDPSSIGVLDADGLTRSNYSSKEIIYSSNKTVHNFTFTSPTSSYVFITFTKYGSDTTGTTVYNPICIEGDYTSKNIEWVKGTQPSIPTINSSGENLFDGKWDTEGSGFEVTGTLKEFKISHLGTYSVKNALPNIKFKPNIRYTFSGKCFEITDTKQVRLALMYTDGSYSSVFYPTSTEIDFNFTSLSGKNIEYVFISYGFSGGITVVKDFMITEGTTAPSEYISPKHSVFKLNDWLGDGEVYENGIITKNWGRVLFSEAYDGISNINVSREITYMYYLKLKKSYSGIDSPSSTQYFYNFFGDFLFMANNKDVKHTYSYVSPSDDFDRMVLFIPKQEIDSLSGSTLEEKFEEWVELNDDYLYYKKASSTTIKSNASSIAGTFGNELNTFSNGSFGKVTFDYQNSVMDSLKALSSSVNSLNTDQIVQDYTQKISDKIVVLKDQTIKQTDWVFDNFNGRYYLEFKNELISPDKVVDVNFGINSYSNARVVLGITSSDYGKVTLYARTKPTVDLIADIIIKGVN